MFTVTNQQQGGSVQRVIVVGAGVVGTTCAVALAEGGLDVHVVARDLPGETSSSLAMQPWLPPPPTLGPDVTDWAALTRAELIAMAGEDDPVVEMVAGRMVYDVGVQRVSAPVVDTQRYLRRLVRRLLATGGTLTRMALTALPDHGTVVNCTGLAARTLVPDASVEPAPFQLIRVADPGLDGWFATPDLHAVADQRGVVICADGHDARTALERAGAVEPMLRGATAVAHRPLLRARRNGIRLDLDGDRQRTVVHCYGHAGSGFSVSWGCARAVTKLLVSAERQ
jgi:D-amino-acid oxidase